MYRLTTGFTTAFAVVVTVRSYSEISLSLDPVSIQGDYAGC
jgi:hypothetical protein